MSTLLIYGSLDEVHHKLVSVKRVIDDKKINGYPLWHDSERWQYVTARDGRVCPICEPHDGQVYSGVSVKQLFPNVEYLGNYEAHPRTHDNPDFPIWIKRREGAQYGCGCRLYLLNPAEAFEAQLHVDKQGVI